MGTWRCCTAAIPEMKRNGYSRIINVTSHMSTSSEMDTGSVSYRVSKAGVSTHSPRSSRQNYASTTSSSTQHRPERSTPASPTAKPTTPPTKQPIHLPGWPRSPTTDPPANSSTTANGFPGSSPRLRLSATKSGE
ncbi:hypothetical protein O7543_13995 [Solwaraspora sp. WMMA2080]|uniref:hypothetical protein n=1 Tax=Solwaraspora sp. WMMA2080 TaxID=3015165 RepID=UPI00248B03E7|nr:hypothetical protein [Solwaraspora sp. WMMA2080]WBC23795.1 hypothetical protein O7543_13995 [Solwaraspora sp. WMMA2080]